MKHLLIYCLFILVSTGALAQADTMRAPYLRFPTIPLFTLLTTDSAKLTRNDIAKNKKTMIMYFSPDCDHCQHQTDSMIAAISKFRDVQILMATYKPFPEMKSFYKKYRIASFSNIRMGRDTQFFFPPFYKIQNLPFMVLYNDKGKLITSFEGTTPIGTLVEAFKTNG